MIRELINFTQNLDPEFKSLGLEPRQGLHLLLKPDAQNEGIFVVEKSQVFRKPKTKSQKKAKAPLDGFLKECAKKQWLSWTVNGDEKPYYQKSLDVKHKGIHSASPFCLAFKKTSLDGGEKYQKDKVKLYDRLGDYFQSALPFVKDEKEMAPAEAFSKFLSSKKNIHSLVGENELKALDEGEYIIFYLNLEEAAFEKANAEYLAEKLFNQSPKPFPIRNELFGVGTFFKTLNSNKPFLRHLTASFDISGFDSAADVRHLQTFSEMIKRGVFPNPLPIFIYENEREEFQNPRREFIKNVVSIFKKEALIENADDRKSHAQIIQAIYQNHASELHNYYLFYFDRLENKICDFDFVSKFEYETKHDGKSWKIQPLFDEGFAPEIASVFGFQNLILPEIFNKALVKFAAPDGSGQPTLRYFESIEPKYCRSDMTYLLTMKYRKSFYDFIYKSQRQAVNQAIFEDVLISGILDDLRRDRIENGFHTQRQSLFRKLNILFSLHQNFIPHQSKSIFMAQTVQDLRGFMATLAEGKGDVQVTQDLEFAFAAGQVIAYLMSKSKADDRSYSRLVPLLQQPDSKRFVEAISAMFVRYAHEPVSNRFKNVLPQISIYQPTMTIKELTPAIIAGALSPNALFIPKKENDGNDD